MLALRRSPRCEAGHDDGLDPLRLDETRKKTFLRFPQFYSSSLLSPSSMMGETLLMINIHDMLEAWRWEPGTGVGMLKRWVHLLAIGNALKGLEWF